MKRLIFLTAVAMATASLAGCRSGGWFNRGAPCSVCGDCSDVCDSCDSGAFIGDPVLGSPTVIQGTPVPTLLPGPN